MITPTNPQNTELTASDEPAAVGFVANSIAARGAFADYHRFGWSNPLNGE